MSKNRNNIGIAIDNEINEKLENNNYNKSKLINSAFRHDWLNEICTHMKMGHIS